MGDRTAMQRSGDQRALRADVGRGLEVIEVAHAPGGIDRPRPGLLDDAPKSIDIRSSAGADTVEAHDDDALGPIRRLGKKRSGAPRAVGGKVERQYEALAEGRAKVLPIFHEAQAFGADDERRAKRQPKGAVGDVGEAGVDPQHRMRRALARSRQSSK